MICYIFDGSFEGLLTSIYEAYYRKERVEEIIPSNKFQPTLLTEPKYIETNEVKSSKVYTAIKNKISAEALELIYHVYLSEIDGCCSLIYNYVKLGFKLGSKVNLYLHEGVVLNIHNISNKVTNECHRMLGFVRFKFIANIYYSSVEPDHNIIGLLAPHFSERLPSERWIIHDIKRNLAVFYNRSEWILTTFTAENLDSITIKEEPEIYESLWKDFFNTITIAERTNPVYQKRNMPKRYWKHLTEFEK
jgi:probable DNA metabolism protein